MVVYDIMKKNIINNITMKSLKSEASIKQVSVDHLLKVTHQPIFTAYLISSLQFESKSSSNIYEISVSQDPKHLRLDTFSLINTIQNLEQWASEIVDLCKESFLDCDIADQDKIVLEENLSLINELLGKNKNDRIKAFEVSINETLDDWKKHHDNFMSKQNQIESYSGRINSNDLNDNKTLSSLKDYMNQLEVNFIDKVGRSFKSESGEFSYLLETVKTNNNKMIENAFNVRNILTKYVGHKYDLRQPMAYLKDKESGLSNEISLGVLSSDNRSLGFQDVCKYLKDNNVINSIQFDLLRRSKNKEDLFTVLKNKGYETIRYYESEETFLHNKDLYKERKNVNKVNNIVNFKNKVA